GRAVLYGEVPAEDGVLLLHAAGLRARRGARVHGALHRRSGAARAGGPHDAGLFDVHAARAQARGALSPIWGAAARGRRLQQNQRKARAMAHAPAAHGSDKYYIPHGSKWPAIGAVTLFVTMLGTAAVLNGSSLGPWIAYLGLAGVAYMFFGWFGTVIDESQRGLYNAGVDRSFRMGMTWFIFSEVMFFAAFFGALYYARQL